MHTNTANGDPAPGSQTEIPIAAVLGQDGEPPLASPVVNEDRAWMLMPSSERTIWPRVWPGL
jgi:hypothetical protein